MKNFLLKTVKWIGLFFIALYCLIWLFTPLASRYFANDILKSALPEYSLALSDTSSIRYNPFLSHLSIYDLTLSKTAENVEDVLVIDELQFEINLYKLLVDQIQITEFDINGLHVKININEGNIEVAGIMVNSASSIATEKEIVEEIKEDSASFITKMAKININNAIIDVNLDHNQHQLTLTNATIENVSASSTTQALNIAIEGALNQAALAINADVNLTNGGGTITSDARIGALELSHFQHLLPEFITSLAGKVSYRSKQAVTLAEDDITIVVDQLVLSTEDLLVEQGDFKIKLAQHNTNSENLAITLKSNSTSSSASNSAPTIEGEMLINLKTLQVLPISTAQEKSTQQVLLQVNSLNIPSITLDTSNINKMVNIADIDLADVLISDDLSNEIPALTQFKNLNIHAIDLSQQAIAIDTITLAGLVTDAQLDKNKGLSNLITLPTNKATNETVNESNENEVAIKEEAPESANTAKSETTTPFAIAINQFTLLDDAQINFIDHSISPTFQRNLTITTLTAGPVNNQTPEIKTNFELIGKTEEYSHFNLSGFTQPFVEKPVYHVSGFIKEVNLPDISTYMKEALQYVFDAGQLDIKLDSTLEDTTIDGNVLIVMRGIELTAADDAEVDSLKDKSAIPFSVALGMLKDGDGNIELDIPLSGDTSDPSFGLSGFITLLIKKATMMATKDYLMTTFVPYANVINIAMAAGEFILKIRFNDLEFLPTQTDLQPEHDEFLTQFYTLLQDKPDENITLCAITTPTDIGKKSGTAIKEKRDIEQLNKLSLTRMNNFKRYMVKEKKLASARLLLCTPQIDNAADAKPRITFSN